MTCFVRPPTARRPATARAQPEFILVYEPQASTRITLCSFLEMTFPHARIEQAQTAERALEISAQEQPQLVLINVDMAGTDDISLIRDLRSRLPDAMLIVTSKRAPAIADDPLLAAGADTVVQSDRLWDQLAPVVKKTAGGKAN